VTHIRLYRETPEEVREGILEEAEIIRIEQLGTTDDCGFFRFDGDTSIASVTVFAKIIAYVWVKKRRRDTAQKAAF
jgi:5-methyltetrahydropteroyltriglutamate--homocysteine methyltransferase